MTARSPDLEFDAWRRKLERWFARQDLSGLERLDGRRVVELRPHGIDKGRVVRALRLPDGHDESLIAIGDDATDEDLFRELCRHGMTIKVGPPGSATLAAERLESVEDVQRFLCRLVEIGVVLCDP